MLQRWCTSTGNPLQNTASSMGPLRKHRWTLKKRTGRIALTIPVSFSHFNPPKYFLWVFRWPHLLARMLSNNFKLFSTAADSKTVMWNHIQKESTSLWGQTGSQGARQEDAQPPAGKASHPLPVLRHLLWDTRAFTPLVATCLCWMATQPHLPPSFKGIQIPLASAPPSEAAGWACPDLGVCSAPTGVTQWSDELPGPWSQLSSLSHAITTNPSTASCHCLWTNQLLPLGSTG